MWVWNETTVDTNLYVFCTVILNYLLISTFVIYVPHQRNESLQHYMFLVACWCFVSLAVSPLKFTSDMRASTFVFKIVFALITPFSTCDIQHMLIQTSQFHTIASCLLHSGPQVFLAVSSLKFKSDMRAYTFFFEINLFLQRLLHSAHVIYDLNINYSSPDMDLF